MAGSGAATGYLRARPLVADTLLALAVAVAGLAVDLVLAAVLPTSFPGGPPHPAAIAIASLVGAAPIALRRRAPWPATGAAVILTVLPALLHLPLVSQGACVACLSYTSAARMPLRLAVPASLLLWAPGLVLAGAGTRLPVLYAMTGGNPLLPFVTFFVGRTVHNRRGYSAALVERTRMVAAVHRSRTERAVADERRRIARELHDVVAHHVSVMGVLATGARRTLARQPDAADEALAAIEETGRTALREMRRLLDVLRPAEDAAAENAAAEDAAAENAAKNPAARKPAARKPAAGNTAAKNPAAGNTAMGNAPGADAADLAPQPDLSGLSRLTDQVREAGLPATLTVTGRPVPVEPGIALAAYRIVQEALTNVLKHAGTATAEVRLGYGTHALTVEVLDTGYGPPPEAYGVGHGLLGMRERVALYGGTLHTGARPGGGFRVCATLPLDARGRP